VAKRSASHEWSRGIEDLKAVLRGITDPKRQARMLEAGIKAAADPLLVAAKRFAKRSEDTGALRDSLTIKTDSYPTPGHPVAVALVGPDRGYRVKGRKINGVAALLAAKKGLLRKPANYAHLIEFGHAIAVGGSLRDTHELKLVGTGRYSLKTGKELKRWKKGAVKTRATGRSAGFVPPRPFIRPATMLTKGKQNTEFAKALEKEMARELSRLTRG